MAETIAAVAVAAGASASTAATIGSTVATVGTVAGTVGSLASAGMAIAGSQAQAGAMRNEADRQNLAAQGELLRGQSEANQVRSALLRTLAAQNARAAGAGLALDDGVTATLADEAERQAEIELGIRRGNTLTAFGDRAMGADALRDRADSSELGGLVRGGIGIFDAADRWYSRQGGTAATPRRRVSADSFTDPMGGG